MSAGFATTQWSLVLAARDGSDTEARTALAELCSTYWHPLYVYLRSRGNDPDEAHDLTQAFFTDLLNREGIRHVDRSKGRFRSFLLASLRNFVSHQHEKATALKRGGGKPALQLDIDSAESVYRRAQVERSTPEEIFEVRWGLTVMERAMDRLRADAAAREKAGLFESLKPYLTGAEPHDSYQQAGRELGLSEGAVKAAVHRLRRRYGCFLRDEIAQTVVDPAEVDDEVRHLLAVIRPWQSSSA